MIAKIKRRIFSNIKLEFHNVTKSLKNIKTMSLDDYSRLIPFLMVLAAIISGIGCYILFIVQDGYSIQIATLKKNGIDGLADCFTFGTRELMYKSIPAFIFLGLFIVQLVLMLIKYFKDGEKVIIMTIDLSMMLFSLIMLAICFVCENSNSLKSSLIEFIAVLGLMVFGVISIIMFIVLIAINKDCRWKIGHCFISALFQFAIVPFFILILENIIPLIIGIIIAVIALSIICGILCNIGGKKKDNAVNKQN